MTSSVVKFNKTDYTREALEKESTEKLLELRNLVATNLGVATVQRFKDHEQAVEQTWKALERFDATVKEEAKGEDKTKKTKPKKESGPRKLAKSAEAKTVKRPTRKMFSTIEKIGEHDGASHGRAHRWPNYKNGMTIVDVIETEGTEPWDVYNWESHGIMKVHEPTDEQFAERKAAWYKKHGREDPDVKKAREAEEKAKRKAEADAKKAAEAEEKAKSAA